MSFGWEHFNLIKSPVKQSHFRDSIADYHFAQFIWNPFTQHLPSVAFAFNFYNQKDLNLSINLSSSCIYYISIFLSAHGYLFNLFHHGREGHTYPCPDTHPGIDQNQTCLDSSREPYLVPSGHILGQRHKTPSFLLKQTLNSKSTTGHDAVCTLARPDLIANMQASKHEVET